VHPLRAGLLVAGLLVAGLLGVGLGAQGGCGAPPPAVDDAATFHETRPMIGEDQALQLARAFVAAQPAPSSYERYDTDSAMVLRGFVPGAPAAHLYIGFDRTPVRARVLDPDVVRVDRRSGEAAWFSHPADEG